MTLLAVMMTSRGYSRNRDTVTIDASRVNTSVLKPGVNRYLVYFKNGRDSSRIAYQVWTRTVEFLRYRGRDAISVRQEWEDNTSVTHRVYSVNDRRTFAPLFHDTWWKRSGSGQFDFISKTAHFRDTLLSRSDTLPARKRMFDAFSQALDQYVLNWHLDLEVFSTLPYRENVSFKINFYDPGFGLPSPQVYSVSGSGVLTGYDGQKMDCWLLTHDSAGGKETFWVSKKTREVLKLEQEFNGRFRYKIKLGFST
jgi:hypothetical protein